MVMRLARWPDGCAPRVDAPPAALGTALRAELAPVVPLLPAPGERSTCGWFRVSFRPAEFWGAVMAYAAFPKSERRSERRGVNSRTTTATWQQVFTLADLRRRPHAQVQWPVTEVR